MSVYATGNNQEHLDVNEAGTNDADESRFAGLASSIGRDQSARLLLKLVVAAYMVAVSAIGAPASAGAVAFPQLNCSAPVYRDPLAFPPSARSTTLINLTTPQVELQILDEWYNYNQFGNTGLACYNNTLVRYANDLLAPAVGPLWFVLEPVFVDRAELFLWLTREYLRDLRSRQRQQNVRPRIERTPWGGGGIRGSIPLLGFDLVEGSPAFSVSQTSAVVAPGSSLRFYFIVDRAGPGDWLEISNRGETLWRQRTADLPVGRLIEVRLTVSGTVAVPGILGFYLNSDDVNDSSVFVVTGVDGNEVLDTDADGVNDFVDNCTLVPNAGQSDLDVDGLGDSCDQCAATTPGDAVDDLGCSESQVDTDRDGVPDGRDSCPLTISGQLVDSFGCSSVQLDTDGDGVINSADDCDATPASEPADTRGCSASQRDADSDGVPDATDRCPATPAGAAVDATGCAATQRDTDGDGVNDALDQCAGTPIGSSVGPNGCPLQSRVCDIDRDNDVDRDDIRRILERLGRRASSVTDPADANRDGRIDLRDAASCVLKCSKWFCLAP